MKHILILVIIVVIKAIFAASETAFTYLNKAKISHMSKRNKRAKKINEMIEKNHRFFGLTEVGITMCELFASVIAGDLFVNQLSEKFIKLSWNSNAATVVSIIIVTIVLSYLLLVFGLLLPKRIARNHPEQTAFRLINILTILSIINYPFEKIVKASTTVFCKILGIKENDKELLTEKEIKMIISEGKEQGIIDKVEKEILFKTLKYNDILVKEIMTQKEKVDFINLKDDTEKILTNIQKYKYTRMPVYEGNRDNIVGVLNIKDILMKLEDENKIKIHIKELIRPSTFIEKNEKITNAFKIMQANKQGLLIAIDESKKVVGIITMEDILEKLVGEILDEYGK